MKKLVSIFLIVAMLGASLLAIIPASADDTYVTNLLPNGVLDELKRELAASTSKLNAFADFAPYVYTNTAVNQKIADSKILSITIPVNKTEGADANGNFYFTLGVLPTNKVTAVASQSDFTKYRIAIKGSDYGLSANASAFKFIKVDLTAYNIYVRENETLTFFDDSDTLIPIWVSDSSNELHKTISTSAPEFMGFAARAGNLGGGYNPSTTSCIIYDLELEKGGEAPEAPEPEPIVPADQIDFTNYETRRFMPEDVYNGMVDLYVGNGAGTNNWVPSVAPFTQTNPAFQARFAGTRLRTITLPVNKTLGLDSDGNLLFTIHTWKADSLTSANGKVNSWTLKIKAADYGLAANQSNIYKLITVDLSSYNIVVAKDEVLSFFTASDTLLPGYSGNMVGYFQTNFSEMMGFGAYTGDSKMPDNTYASGVIFFDFTYDVPTSKSYLDLKGLYNEGVSYIQSDFTSGWSAFKSALDAATAKIANTDPAADFTAEYNALKSAMDALVLNANPDKTALNKAINDAANYDGKQADYTTQTWTAFAEALADANTVKAKSDARQSEINLATEALNEAMAGLISVGNIDDLAQKIADIKKEYNGDSYTSTSYQKLTNAIKKAENAVKSGNITDAEYSTLVKELVDAAAGLEKRGDFTELNELVAKYENLSDKQYDPFYLEAVERAIQKIKDAQKPVNAKDTTESDIKILREMLESAIADLVEFADFVQIDIKLAEVNKLKESDYTATSWKNLQAVLTKVKNLQANTFATKDESDALLAELNAAVAALVKVENNNAEADEDVENIPAEDEQTKTETSTDATNDASGDADNTVKSGCGSVIGATAVVMSATLALGGATLLKKKED